MNVEKIKILNERIILKNDNLKKKKSLQYFSI